MQFKNWIPSFAIRGIFEKLNLPKFIHDLWKYIFKNYKAQTSPPPFTPLQELWAPTKIEIFYAPHNECDKIFPQPVK